MTASALYEGEVYHRRRDPGHAFEYRVAWLYLDLDEIPDVFRGTRLWSAGRPSLGWFRRTDYMGPVDRPLKSAVLDRVQAELGRRPGGRVRVLTQARVLGYVFNPVSIYYCFEASGELGAVAAEITSTPWRERHTYVLDARRAAGPLVEARFAKDFHVSPFLGMEQEYVWRLGVPGERLDVHMTNLEGRSTVFCAGLSARRVALTPRSLRRLLLRHPLQTFRVHGAIYWQALRLWLKRAPFHPHPEKRAPVGDAPVA